MAAPAEPATHWTKKPLTLRIISAAVLIPIVVAAVYAGGLAWTLLVALFSIAMIVEWCRIAARRPGAVPWYALGLVYVFVPCVALIWLRNDPDVGLQQIFWIVALVIAADTGAYIAGRSIGGPKLAPRISPNKTWAGLLGGIALATAFGWFLHWQYGLAVRLTLATPFLALLAQGGDLFESWLKRRAGKKDSGALFPGHGGALDRLDGLVPVAPAAAFLVVIVPLLYGWRP